MTRKYEILDAAEKTEYKTFTEILNDCMGANVKGWMKATWPKILPNMPFRVWYVKLAKEKDGKLISAAHGCLNTLSEDWNTLIYEDEKDGVVDESKMYFGPNLIFAREPNGGPIFFRGAFKYSVEESDISKKHFVSKRVATKVRLVGDPVTEFILLDNVEEKKVDIQSPLKPKEIIKEGTIIKYVCPNCDYKMIKAPRCPECGQLIDYSEE